MDADLGFHPAVSILDCVVMSDAGTSDHHVLIRHPVAAGMVAFLSHDGCSRIVHADLASFMVAARRAADEDLMLEKVDPEEGLSVPNGMALDELLASIEDEGERDQVRYVLAPEA